jgi:CHAT domain-containing protein/tetratricopeptide (TPR) repeat protein
MARLSRICVVFILALAGGSAWAQVQMPALAPLVARAHAAAAVDDFPTAENAWREVLDWQIRQYGPESPRLGETLLELALEVSNQARFDEAAALFRRAAPILDAAGNADLRNRAILYHAFDAANRRDYEGAARFARQAALAHQAEIDQLRAAGPDESGNLPPVPVLLSGELARDLWVQAEMALRLGDLPGAQAAGERSLYILASEPDLPMAWRPQVISLMASINAKQGNTVAAEKQYLQALAIDRALSGDNGPATIAAQLRLGEFYAGEQVYGPALEAYGRAFAALDKNPATHSHIMPDQVIPFLDAASAGKANANAMFLASQRVHAGVESQTIARVAARRAAQNPALLEDVRASEEAVRHAAGLRAALANEHAKPDGERDPVQEKTLADSTAAAEVQSARLAAKLRTDFPAYAKLSAPDAAPLAAVQQALRPREAFVSYLLGVNRGYVLLVTQAGLTVRPMGSGSAGIVPQIAAVRASLAPRLGKPPAFDSADALALYNSLLAPVEPELAGIDHLIVGTGDDFTNLPFGLLLTADAPRDYVHAPWLVRRMAVSNVPSAAALLALRAMPVVATPRPLLAVGGPALDGAAGQARAFAALSTACQGSGPADPALLRALPPLPDTVAEMQAVARDLKAQAGDVLSGGGATEAGLRARPLDQYAVLYFATHGLLPGELHCQAEPGLVLTPPTAAGNTDSDGLLTASEVAELRLNAALVVLSACNTAAAGGTGFGGGALQGLADAFFDAGAHAVLATQWEVPSAETTSLMMAMFDQRRDSAHGTAAALRSAQLAAIARAATAHPYDWAAFTLIGDGT